MFDVFLWDCHLNITSFSRQIRGHFWFSLRMQTWDHAIHDDPHLVAVSTCRKVENWVVVSNIFYFYPYLGKSSNLTNIFQMGWNHQLENVWADGDRSIHTKKHVFGWQVAGFLADFQRELHQKTQPLLQSIRLNCTWGRWANRHYADYPIDWYENMICFFF